METNGKVIKHIIPISFMGLKKYVNLGWGRGCSPSLLNTKCLAGCTPIKNKRHNKEVTRNSVYISCCWSHSKYIHIFWVTLDVLLIYTFPVHTVQ